MANTKSSGTKPANAERVYHITGKDLPLACPLPDMTVWNSHPRVFLPIEKTGHEVCPYCGAEFFLDKNKNDQSTSHAHS